jgi:hypothetical protein
MKIKNTIKLSIGAALALSSISFASEARIEALGKSTRFIMDDMSIFDNAANTGIYPNYLIGSIGGIQSLDSAIENRDPQEAWYGGIFSIGLGDDKFRDPKFTIGGALGREDKSLTRFLPDAVLLPSYFPGVADTVGVPTPISNFDGFLGFSTENGNLFGAHIYVAMQEGIQDPNADGESRVSSNAYAGVYKLDIGTNFRFDEDKDWEVSTGVTRIDFGDDGKDLLDADEMGFFVDTRMTSNVDLINGQFIPAGRLENINAPRRSFTHFDMGMGITSDLPAGFFWLGAQYVFEEDRSHYYTTDKNGVVYANQLSSVENIPGTSTLATYSGVISFGIEKNIWTDWFIIRVGGRKVLGYNECKFENNELDNNKGFCGEAGTYFSTNNAGDSSLEDNLGIGFGVNVEEKLKVDATISEDAFFRNPFTSGGKILTKISATYSF